MNQTYAAGDSDCFPSQFKPKNKRMTDTLGLRRDANVLNEEILEAAERFDGEYLAPEVSPGTAEITVWDEAPEVVGWRVEAQPMENQVTISEQLVSEGNERADREQRMAAGWGAL